MAHYLTNNEKFHIFSKSPVLSSMAVSQAVNKSGHTVSTNDVWADDIPWFTEVADEAGAITRAADARYNDLILWGSDIYVRKGDKTNGASTGTTFAELWEKHTDLTEARAYALGSVTTQTPTNIVTKTVEIKNASDKVVLKYHVGKQIDLLTTTNNANVASTWAARMFIDGKVVDQFVSPTDKVFAGNPSTGYTTLVYTAAAAGNKYGFVSEGETDGDFVNNAFAGIVQFNQSRNSTHKFAASVFEYVGSKLDAAVSELKTAVFGGDDTDGNISLSQKVAQNTAAINTLNGADTIDGSVAKTVKDATDTLDSKINGVAATANSAIQSVTAPGATTTNTAVTIEAATLNNDNKSFNNDTYFAKAGDVITVATTLANEVDAKLTPITELITAAQSTADEAKEIAEGAVQSAEDAAQSITDLSNTAISATSTGSDNVTVTLGGTVSAPTLSVTGTDIASAQTLTNLEQKVNEHLLDAAGKLEITVLADKLPKKSFFEADTAYVNSYGFEWEKLSNNIYTNKFEVKVAQSLSGLNEVNAHKQTIDVVLTPSPLAAQTCKLVVYSFDDTTQLTEVAVSQPNTFDASTSIYAFKFDNQISLSAGVRYRICFRTVDGTNALHCLPVIVNSSNQGADVTKHETPTRYIISERDVENNNDWWGCWNTGAGTVNGVEQVAYGPKVSVSGLTPTPDEDGNTLIGEKGKIYLIPNTGTENQNVYDEYVWTNDTWEKIGSTKVDLTDYVTNSSLTTTLTGYVTMAEKSVLESQISAAQTTAQNAQTTANSKVSQTAYDTKISELEEAISNAAPANYVTSINNSEGAQAFTIKDGRETVYPNDLWGTTVSMVDNTITVQGGPIDGSGWGPKNGYNTKGNAFVNDTVYNIGSNPITKVENNMVYNGTTEVANIKTNEIVDGRSMFHSASLASFSGDLSNLVNGSMMFRTTSLASFTGDLSSLVNGYMMFNETPLTSFNGDLSNLVNGNEMFYHTSLASFSGNLSNLVSSDEMFRGSNLVSFNYDLNNLVNGSKMFGETPLTSFNCDLSNLVRGNGMFSSCNSLTSFNGDLSNLIDGENMFSYSALESFNGDLSNLVNGFDMFLNTSLDVESVELICDVLPNYNTENGGKTLQAAIWNESEGKYTYNDWTSGNYYYPIIKISNDYDPMSQGNVDGISRSFGTEYFGGSSAKSITIYWEDISVLSDNDKETITKLFTDTATEKGWTFITNTELGRIVSPNAVMSADGTIQYYVLAKKDEATEDNATHIDASGKLWKFDTAEAIIGPNIKYWSMFATVEDALTEWELTPWTKPAEEESAE